MADRIRSTPRRRALLGAATALPALGAVGAAKAALPNPDAQLIALCDEVMRIIGERDAIFDRHTDLAGDWSDIPGEEAKVDALCDRRRALSAEIARTPAATSAGLAAKARVLMDGVGLDSDGLPLMEDRLTASLCMDIIRAAT